LKTSGLRQIDRPGFDGTYDLSDLIEHARRFRRRFATIRARMEELRREREGAQPARE
jgi:hypothetical protein